MLIKEFDPAQTHADPVNLGDTQPLKEIQPRLQLTEDQYNFWSEKQQILLVEFEATQKIHVIHVAPPPAAGRPGWTAFETLNEVMK